VRENLCAPLARVGRVFEAMYAKSGHDSIAPEKLLRALMVHVI
jgi:hypothetical protein